MKALATVSKNYRVTIPQDVRKRFNLKLGQRIVFVPDGKSILLVVAPPNEEARGMLKGMNAKNIREEVDEER